MLSTSTGKYAKEGLMLIPCYQCCSFQYLKTTTVITSLRDYFLPEPVLSALHKLTSLIPTTALLVRYIIILILQKRQ